MTPIRAIIALSLTVAIALPRTAAALSLPEAIALSQRANPTLARSRAEAEAAEARVDQARAGLLPSLTLSGQAANGTTDFGGFFGFGQAEVSPRGVTLEMRQPAYTGGGVSAAIERAQEARNAALAQAVGAKAMLTVQVAETYVAVLNSGELLTLHEAQVRQMEEYARQANLRFQAGEVARTDLAQTQARLAQAQSDRARARGDVARSRARFVSMVGIDPEGLDPLPTPLEVPRSLDEAIATALRTSPALAASRAESRAAAAGVRVARAEGRPSLAVTATASSARDQFFPGYRADSLVIGVQGRWTLFSGGLIKGRSDEARAEARSAQAALNAVRSQVVVAVTDAWEDNRSARAVLLAAADQASAAAGALDSIRNEVRVGQKPALDLLDAERDAIAAQSGLLAARGALVTGAYRLNALLGGD